MCRLFCMLSVRPSSASEHILSGRYSIIKQAKAQKHSDGWGYGRYTDGRLDFVARGTEPAASDEALIRSLSSVKSSSTLFFVRKASNPLGLERKKLLTVEATQPFSKGNLLFAHNGSVNDPTSVLEALKGYTLTPRSNNDSEAYFLAFMRGYERGMEAGAALKEAERMIIRTFKRTRKNHEPFSSLNVIVILGNRIYAYNRYANRKRKGLSDMKREFFKMCYRVERGSLVVASEPTDDGEWNDLGDGKLLEGWVQEGKVKIKVREL